MTMLKAVAMTIGGLLLLSVLTSCGGGGGSSVPSNPSTTSTTLSSTSSSNAKTIEWQPDGHGFAQMYTDDTENYDSSFWNTYPETAEQRMTTVTAIAEKRSGSMYYAYGIIFCYQNDSNFYGLFIDGNGKYCVYKEVGGHSTAIIPWTTPNLALLNRGGAANVMSVTQNSLHNFSISFNGIFERQFSDSNFTGGQAGFFLDIPASDEDFSKYPEDVRFKLTSPVEYPANTTSTTNVPLSYVPLQIEFSKSLGKAIMVSGSPNALHIVDPQSAADVTIPLPAEVTSIKLSPDGTLAAVLHDGLVSLVDLKASLLSHSWNTGQTQTASFINNSGRIYLTGQNDTPGFTVLDGKTGTIVQTLNTVGQMWFTTAGIFSESNNKIFTLSGTTIYSNDLDPITGALQGHATAATWTGVYAQPCALWLSSDESLLFTQNGTYFSASDFKLQGNLASGTILSMSHSTTAAEAAVLSVDHFQGYDHTLYYSTPVYHRFTGASLSPADDIPLPMIGGQQTYGEHIFHAADDRHVVVVRTGADAGKKYYLVYL